jgi:cell wall-associated NlpC family hydrolase
MIAPPTWFSTPERVLALERAAQGWAGTPFVPRSAVRGRGVCCHMLIAEILFECGAVTRIDLPQGSPGWARHHGSSPIADWLDGMVRFKRLDLAGDLLAGDVVGCRIGRAIHHLAIVLPGGRFAHALEGHGAVVVDCLPKSVDRRIAAAWRVQP